MFEQYEQIVNQYHIQVHNFYKGRGAIILDTDQGLKLLKEVQMNEHRLRFLNDLQDGLKSHGFQVDTIFKAKNGELMVEEDYKKYVMKNWTEGREILFSDRAEVNMAVRLLANMHLTTRKIPLAQEYHIYDKTNCLGELYERHNKELIRIKNSIKRMGRWSEFDLLFLETFDGFYSQAESAVALIEHLFEESQGLQKGKAIIHGQYNHHNLIFDAKNQLHIMNFDYAFFNLPVVDLYSMMRKVLEKNDWDVKLGMEAIDTYRGIHELTKRDMELMVYLFMYPEKFWKISNYYFNLNKAWKPKQTWIKLKKLVAQEDKKQNFIEHLKNNSKS